eukprot:scaffold153231_cov20-Cyclotella_meneghiniana.AAC.1
MDEICTSKVAHSSDVDLRNAVLVMCTNTTVRQLLFLMLTVLLEFFLGKNAIVRMIGLDLDAE